MSKYFENALFLFRRDLRLEDNTGLIFALESSKQVIPAFIFTPQQIQDNPYRGDHCLQFMIESLEELERALLAKGGILSLFYGQPDEVVGKLIKKMGVDAVIVNRDYTPYSKERDQKITKVCRESRVPFYSFEDALLHPPDQTVKGEGKPYTVFTAFYRNASRLEVLKPVANRYCNYCSSTISLSQDSSLYEMILPKRLLPRSGGRKEALRILDRLEQFSYYESLRDFPAEFGTTHLSPHMKFTTCSPREAYWAIVDKLGTSSQLIRSLYWRDFFTSIAFHFPKVFSGAFHDKFNQLRWSDDEQAFKMWCEGRTGFPIVDAGMRQMNETGFMHNRVRMITASFLVKDLHFDWRWGERYFAQKLIDYDPAVNNGNWQWVASTGCDAQPYFRVFNPWIQAKKFDPDTLYIKRWIPELNTLSSKVIHKWYEEKYHDLCLMYPKPMIDHSREAKAALSSYRSL